MGEGVSAAGMGAGILGDVDAPAGGTEDEVGVVARKGDDDRWHYDWRVFWENIHVSQKPISDRQIAVLTSQKRQAICIGKMK